MDKTPPHDFEGYSAYIARRSREEDSKSSIIPKPMSKEDYYDSDEDDYLALQAQIHYDGMEPEEITIDDDGIGIPENEYQNVFKPFYKIDKGRSDSKSSVGLGLSITSDIIKSHGGNILLEKSPLNGLRVKIFLPL